MTSLLLAVIDGWFASKQDVFQVYLLLLGRSKRGHQPILPPHVLSICVSSLSIPLAPHSSTSLQLLVAGGV